MSFIAELRSDKPREIGFLYWLCLGKPCTSFYVPFYFGLTEFPPAFCSKSGDASSIILDNLELHKSISKFTNAYTAFTGYCHYVDSNYIMVAGRANNALKSYHKDMMAERKKAETAALKLYKLDKQKAIEKLQEFTDRQIDTAIDLMKEVISE
jgi:dipeptidase